MRTPYPFQLPILDYLRLHPLAFLGVDKRVGKTICASRWAMHHMPRGGRCLVVAPYSAIPGWLDDFEADGIFGWDLTNPKNLKTWIEAEGKLPGEFFVINPQGLFSPAKGETDPTPKPWALFPWDACIWDESYTLKNCQSQINKVAHACLGDIPLRCAMSGEYAPETPLDVFEQMRWAFGSFMDSQNFWKWRNEHFEQIGYDWLPRKGIQAEIRRIIRERGFVLSRKDAGLEGIPPTWDKQFCDFPQKIRAAYTHAEKYFEVPKQYREPEGVGPAKGVTKYVVARMAWLVQFCGGYPKYFPKMASPHKMNLLRDLLLGEFAHEPVVVSFRHNAEMHTAHDVLSKEGITCDRIWGDLTVDERRSTSRKFREGRFRVMLKQAAVHYGMDLSTADTMFRYSLPDKYTDLSQDADRIVHPEKKSALLYVDLITKNTVDEDLAYSAGDKKIDARYWMDSAAARFQKRVKDHETSSD